jgi:ketosteroid isomerase-like protein
VVEFPAANKILQENFMKRYQSLVLVACLAVVYLDASISVGQDGTKAVDAVRAADQEWMKVFAAKNLEKSVAFCDESGAVLSSNAPAANGRDAIAKLFSGFFQLANLKISWLPNRADVAKSGELGYTSGAYEMTFNDPTGKTISDKGKYVTVWKKQTDGSWKVLLDIFNTDLPAGT